MRADGRKRTRWQWAAYILYLTFIKKRIHMNAFLWDELIKKAKRNGYRLGEHMLGGAFIISKNCLQTATKLYSYNCFVKNKIFKIAVGDDVIMSILAFASGYRLADIARPGDPLAIAQNYLPISKERIMFEKKKLIHSVKKGLDGESESELRSYFRSFRK